MAKRDYTNTDVKNEYKNLAPTRTLTKVTVSSDEKRDRAELLDIVEELFQTQSGGITAQKLRAVLHILVKSVGNTSDDSSLALGSTSTTALRGDTTTITNNQIASIAANSIKNSFPIGPVQVGQTLSFALSSKGNELVITSVTGKTTRSATIALN
tara:strand:- start:364 stop:828 length:465 start_codon:yes stop_codon:yes gene_type:complete